MLNEPKLNPNDSLGVLLRSAYGKMNPPPALEQAARSGIPYTPRTNTAIHVRRFTKAIASYVICVALLIGGVYVASQLMSEQRPVATKPTDLTTTVNDPENPDQSTIVDSPYTALPNTSDLLLELAQYGSLDVIDAQLNALNLKLSTEPSEKRTMAELQQILNASGKNHWVIDPLQSQSYVISTLNPQPTSTPIAGYTTETGELVIVHLLDCSRAGAPYERILMMVLHPDQNTYTVIANFYTDYLNADAQLGNTPIAKEQYNVNRLLSVKALTGQKMEITGEVDASQCDALKSYLLRSLIYQTRMSFYTPRDYNVYEFAHASVPIHTTTADKYGLEGFFNWRALNRKTVTRYFETYLGITPTDETWSVLNEQHWDGEHTVKYVEENDTYYVSMSHKNNYFHMDDVFKAWETDDGRIIVYTMNDIYYHVTILLNPTADGSYHIEAVQVLNTRNILE